SSPPAGTLTPRHPVLGMPQATQSTRAFFWLCAGPLGDRIDPAAEQQRHDEQDQEDEQENLGEVGEVARETAEAEHSGDQGEHGEQDCETKHRCGSRDSRDSATKFATLTEDRAESPRPSGVGWRRSILIRPMKFGILNTVPSGTAL